MNAFIKKVLVRILAVANLVFVLMGYYDLSRSLRLSSAVPPNWTAEFHYTKTILYVMFVLSGLLLSFLVWGSIQLIRSQSTGVLICCFVYGFEIVLWFIDIPTRYISLWLGREDLVKLAVSLMANSVLGMSAISAQMSVLYPVFGLIVLILLRSRPVEALS